MSLEKYCRGRLIVLRTSDTAFQAARAMDSNHVGTVMAHSKGRVMGMVTDRDLALRVVGRGLDPLEVRLRDVMTPDPATVEIDQSEGEAAALMRGMLVRRLVILDRGRLAGLVSLDDLLINGAIDPADVRGLIIDQLSEGSAAKPEGLVRPMRLSRRGDGALSARRRQDRRSQTLRAFVARLQRELDLVDPQDALDAFEVVAANLVRRLTPGEAKDFAAQLPGELRERLLDVRSGPDRSVTLERIEAELARRLELDRESARRLALQVGQSLRDFISPGELADVRGQLPRELQQLIPEAA